MNERIKFIYFIVLKKVENLFGVFLLFFQTKSLNNILRIKYETIFLVFLKLRAFLAYLRFTFTCTILTSRFFYSGQFAAPQACQRAAGRDTRAHFQAI